MHFKPKSESIWDSFVKNNDIVTVAFAKTWAELMETELAQRNVPRDPQSVVAIGRATMDAAGFEGISTLEFIKATKALGSSWLYGAELLQGLK